MSLRSMLRLSEKDADRTELDSVSVSVDEFVGDRVGVACEKVKVSFSGVSDRVLVCSSDLEDVTVPVSPGPDSVRVLPSPVAVSEPVNVMISVAVHVIVTVPVGVPSVTVSVMFESVMLR